MAIAHRLMAVVLVFAISFTLAGCSTTKSVSVVTEPGNWITGQHDYCVYKAGKLVCTPQATVRIPVPEEMKGQTKPGDKIKIEDVLFMNGVGFMSDVEDILQKPGKEMQVSVFDTKFSEKPEDYSIWNCISTGTGSPAVECKVMKQPNAKDKEFIQRKLTEQQEVKSATLKMSSLTHKSMEERCGQPLQRAEDNISVVELYKGESTLLAFHFDTFPAPEDKLTVAASLDSPPAKLDHAAVLNGKHHWWGGRMEKESPWYLKQLSCLNQ